MSYAKFRLPVLALFVAGLFATISIAAQPAQADEPPSHQFDLTAHWSETANGAVQLSWQPLLDAHSYWIHLTDNTETRLRWLPDAIPGGGEERYIYPVSGLVGASAYSSEPAYS